MTNWNTEQYRPTKTKYGMDKLYFHTTKHLYYRSIDKFIEEKWLVNQKRGQMWGISKLPFRWSPWCNDHSHDSRPEEMRWCQTECYQCRQVTTTPTNSPILRFPSGRKPRHDFVILRCTNDIPNISVMTFIALAFQRNFSAGCSRGSQTAAIISTNLCTFLSNKDLRGSGWCYRQEFQVIRIQD